jgi:hypothetical protein
MQSVFVKRIPDRKTLVAEVKAGYVILGLHGCSYYRP